MKYSRLLIIVSLVLFYHLICIQPLKSEDWQRQGIAYYDAQQFDDALEAFNKAIEKDTNNPKLYYYRGLIWAQKRYYYKAIFNFNSAIRIHPEYAQAHYNRGLVHFKLKKYRDAYHDVSRSLQIDPNNHEAKALKKRIANIRRFEIIAIVLGVVFFIGCIVVITILKSRAKPQVKPKHHLIFWIYCYAGAFYGAYAAYLAGQPIAFLKFFKLTIIPSILISLIYRSTLYKKINIEKYTQVKTLKYSISIILIVSIVNTIGYAPLINSHILPEKSFSNIYGKVKSKSVSKFGFHIEFTTTDKITYDLQLPQSSYHRINSGDKIYVKARVGSLGTLIDIKEVKISLED